MRFQAVKGTRDFYPESMRLRNWITDAWRRVSVRNGFEEYDSPIFEYLDLFTIKSGQEIAGQLFNFTDRGGRNLAIRPEITPSLARMINAKINALPRPIKWFSVPRICRAENPQKGRLREFFQWNVDVVGSDDVLADAECIFTAVDFLREIGLEPRDIRVRIGSRSLIVAMLQALGIEGKTIDAVLPVLDKKPKIDEQEFVKLAGAAGLNKKQITAIEKFQDVPPDRTAEFLRQLPGDGPEFEKAVADLLELWRYLEQFGICDYAVLDLRIVRGLAYYTGIVYEIFDAGQSLRAIAGGGRYDNLLQVLDGPQIGATGFGMGDVVLGILLEEKAKIPDLSRKVDFFIIDDFVTDSAEQFDRVIQLAGALRSRGINAQFSYKRQNVGKQLKQADKCGAAAAVIVRSAEELAVKDLATGSQYNCTAEQFLACPLRGGGCK